MNERKILIGGLYPMRKLGSSQKVGLVSWTERRFWLAEREKHNVAHAKEGCMLWRKEGVWFCWCNMMTGLRKMHNVVHGIKNLYALRKKGVHDFGIHGGLCSRHTAISEVCHWGSFFTLGRSPRTRKRKYVVKYSDLLAVVTSCSWHFIGWDANFVNTDCPTVCKIGMVSLYEKLSWQFIGWDANS